MSWIVQHIKSKIVNIGKVKLSTLTKSKIVNIDNVWRIRKNMEIDKLNRRCRFSELH